MHIKKTKLLFSFDFISFISFFLNIENLMSEIMGSIAHSLRIALINMEFDLERRQLIQSGGSRQMSLNDGADPSHQFNGHVQHLQSVQNGVVRPSNQSEDHTGHWHMIQNNEIPNRQEMYAGVSPSSQSVINPSHREMHPNGILRSSHQQMIQPNNSNNAAGPSNEYGDEIISLSSSSSTIYDSSASTASLDFAALYESHRMISNFRSRSIDQIQQYENQRRIVSNNRSRSDDEIDYDSGIDIETNDINIENQMSQVIEYTVQELSPIQQKFIVPVPLTVPPSAMQAPTPQPNPIQRVQRSATVHHIEPLVEPQPPPPVPPRRSTNVDVNTRNGEIFRCVICMESIIGRDPHTTPCGHTLCHHDLNEWLNHYQASTCPYCRDPITYAECIRLYVI